MVVRLTADPIDLSALAEPGDPSAGAEAVFVGWARDRTAGRRVVRLEYEAYGEMAVAELERIVSEAVEQFGVISLDVIHRTGVVRPGEAAVWIRARAPHRAAAFDACRYAIEQLKRRAPIWKKEVFEDGEVWVGERP